MMFKMQSRYQLDSVLALAVLAALLTHACYPHRGGPVSAGPGELVELAERSCARSDEAAARHFLDRLVREHPDSPEASQVPRQDQHARPCAVFVERQQFTDE